MLFRAASTVAVWYAKPHKCGNRMLNCLWRHKTRSSQGDAQCRGTFEGLDGGRHLYGRRACGAMPRCRVWIIVGRDIETFSTSTQSCRWHCERRGEAMVVSSVKDFSFVPSTSAISTCIVRTYIHELMPVQEQHKNSSSTQIALTLLRTGSTA